MRTGGAPPTRVVLVRHGETLWNRRGVYQGWRDAPLSPLGYEQAHRLAEALARVPLDAAYTSPLGRARETAAALLDGRGVDAVEEPALRELRYGTWEGLEPAVRRAGWGDLEARWAADPWSVAPPGGESLTALSVRVLPAWEAIVARHAGGTVLVSAHGHVNRVILLHALGLPPTAFWDVAQPNGAATLLACGATNAALDAGRGA